MTVAPKLMKGSTTGPSYLLIARRGNIALGIKMVGLMPAPGPSPDLTYLACRLRSATYGFDMEHELQEDKVVNLADSQLTFTSAWPGIEFTKDDKTRASAVLGFFMRGNLAKDPIGVMQSVVNDGHIEKLVEFITGKVGHEHLVLRPQVIVSWAKGEIQPRIDHMLAEKKKLEDFYSEIEGSIGVPDFQETQMKLLKKHYAQETEAQTAEPAADAEPSAPKIVKKPKKGKDEDTDATDIE